ncbi:MAG: PepSY domain-containing protein [Candidatus Krumholzibacteria bacterium]|jgi:hypothetical protein|nr:PepSY domain-containing protein [Candidatus Krumholzibacteria bacterium]
MKYKNKLLTGLIFGLLLAPLSAWAGDLPPTDSKPLSEILLSVEQQRLGVFSEAEFDDGLWELKVCDSGACQKLYIAPRSGDEIRRRRVDLDETPPANAKPISVIVQSVEALGLGVITEVEFDDGFWEIDIHKDRRKTKLIVDPITGETKR